MGPAQVEEKYGVPPTRYSDLAAMVGESSDNLPGVPGVGPKTAAKWITQFGDLDGIVASIDQIKGKAGDVLREHLDQVLRNRRLNQLVKDVPVGVTVDDLERAQWAREEVHEVFDRLEFRVLRDRLFAEVEASEPEAESGFDVDGVVLEPRPRCRPGSPSTSPPASGPACPSPARGPAAPATRPGSPSPRPTARPRGSTSRR